MQATPPTIIYRHRRENLKKCSLRGLEVRDDILFFTYPKDQLPSLEGYLFLTLDAPPLTCDDKDLGLCLFDATWRYAETMVRQSADVLERAVLRSLPPHYRTAYPRRQDDCVEPELGLASVEALFIAYRLSGRSTEGLLDYYYWKEKFLEINNLI